MDKPGSIATGKLVGISQMPNVSQNMRNLATIKSFWLIKQFRFFFSIPKNVVLECNVASRKVVIKRRDS